MTVWILLFFVSLPQSTFPVPPAQDTLTKSSPDDLVKAAIRRGIAENRPLLVWVGSHDSLIQRKLQIVFPQVSHVNASEWNGVTSGLIVMVPKDGWLWWRQSIPMNKVNTSLIQLELDMFKSQSSLSVPMRQTQTFSRSSSC